MSNPIILAICSIISIDGGSLWGLWNNIFLLRNIGSKNIIISRKLTPYLTCLLPRNYAHTVSLWPSYIVSTCVIILLQVSLSCYMSHYLVTGVIILLHVSLSCYRCHYIVTCVIILLHVSLSCYRCHYLVFIFKSLTNLNDPKNTKT